MHLPTAAGKQHPAAYVASLVATLAPLYYVSWRYHAAHPYIASPSHSEGPLSTDFVADWLGTQLIDPFNPSAIAAYCNQTEWRENLVFNLGDTNGGVSNVRGNMLDFIFYAIEAGASIMLPSMASRSQEDISNVWASRSPFDHFFDETWFLHAMSEACPQMQIYKPQEDQQLIEPLPGNYVPPSRRLDEDPIRAKADYLENLDRYLNGKPEYDPANLTLVNTTRTLWNIDTRSLPRGFRRNFGQILRVHPPARRLAAVVLQNLRRQYPIVIDPRDAVPPRAFYGAHLRTEADATSAEWLSSANFSVQMDAYLDDALKHGLRLLYVATGNASELERFKVKAGMHLPSLNLTSKRDLLSPRDMEVLESLTWDQQALVDYEVLQRCSAFGGFVKSSFSFGVAMKRAQWGEDMGRAVNPFYATHAEVGVAFDDGLSRILGRDGFHEERIPRGMWP